jgi:hypothetical protein
MTEVQKISNLEARSDRSSVAENKMEPPHVGCHVSDEELELSPIGLQFPQFMDIAVRRDEPLSLSQINEQILTLTTDYRLPNV